MNISDKIDEYKSIKIVASVILVSMILVSITAWLYLTFTGVPEPNCSGVRGLNVSEDVENESFQDRRGNNMELILYNKGDVESIWLEIYFEDGNSSKYYLTEGDRLQLENGSVYLNGSKIDTIERRLDDVNPLVILYRTTLGERQNETCVYSLLEQD